MSDTPHVPVGVLFRAVLWVFGRRVGGWDEPFDARHPGWCVCRRPIMIGQQIRARPRDHRDGREYRHDNPLCLVR